MKEFTEDLVSGVDRDHGMFDVVVGNPPYQEVKADGNGSLAIYHNFMLTSQSAGEYVSLVYPARWLTGGRGEGINEFREEELNSQNYIKFVLDPRSDFFENVTLEGGVNYFLWQRDRIGTTGYIYGDNALEVRSTLLNGIPIFIRDSRFSKIVEKVKTKTFLKPTGVGHYGRYLTSEQNIENYFSEEENALKIYYSGKGGGVREDFIRKDSTSKPTGGYKVLLSKTAHSSTGTLRRPSRIFIIEPNQIYSTSFTGFIDLPTREQAENLVKYLKTDFAMFLLGIITPTQNAVSPVYRLIPAIDPATGEIYDKPGTFIDFSANSDGIDDQLARVYGLTDEDRELIQENISPWKDKNSLTADGLF